MATDGTQESADTFPAGMIAMSPEDAMRAMQAGEVPARLRVEGELHFFQQDKIAPPLALPSDELVAGSIVIHDASQLTQWPHVVRCHQLVLWQYQLDLPPNSQIEMIMPAGEHHWGTGAINLRDCPHLTHVPELRGYVHELRMWRCPQLTSLPMGL
jgi:hypothetical protein